MKAILREPKKIVPVCIAALFFLTIYLNSYPNTMKVVLYPIYREVIREGFVSNGSSFKYCETDNFIIYYKDSSIMSLKMIRDNSEESLRSILSDFDYVPYSKINIIIYPEYSEMADKIGLGNGSTAMGVYYGGTISILEPKRWIGAAYNSDEIFRREGPVLHELSHYMLDYMSGGNLPVWFTEGVALYEEYRHNGVEWAADKTYTSYYSVDELEHGFYNLDEVKAYKQSFLIVKYIVERYGIRAIQDMAKELRLGKSMDQAVDKVLKTNIAQLLKGSL
jgi:hypothetical protein